MGRRKIAIEPLTDERNRAVTFIKRKAGLLKKAHELAVLCQVDVAVLILGANGTFYEFSSMDMCELLNYYLNNKDVPHHVKDPSDYGTYTKKAVVLPKDNPTRHSTVEDTPTVDNVRYSKEKVKKVNKANGRFSVEKFVVNNNNRPVRVSKRTAPDTDIMHPKKQKQEEEEVLKPPILPTKPSVAKYNIQTQFRNLYNPILTSASFTGFSTPRGSNDGISSHVAKSSSVPPPLVLYSKENSKASQIQKDTINRDGSPARPILRVQIPSSNKTKDDKDDVVPEPQIIGSYSPNISNQKTSDTLKPAIDKHLAGKTIHDASSDASVQSNEKSEKSSANSLQNGSYGLPSVFSAFPSSQAYLATPLQPSNGNTSNNPTGLLPPNMSNHLFARQAQQQQGQQQVQGRANSPLLGENLSAPLTGSLPSKFVHDLMMPSPSAPISLFQDWALGPSSAKPEYIQGNNPNTEGLNKVNGTAFPNSVSGQSNSSGRTAANSLEGGYRTKTPSESNDTTSSENNNITVRHDFSRSDLTPYANQPSSATGRYLHLNNDGPAVAEDMLPIKKIKSTANNEKDFSHSN